MCGQPVQTHIKLLRLLLEEQSDQGLHCLPFYLHLFKVSHYHRSLNLRVLTVKLVGAQTFGNFMLE